MKLIHTRSTTLKTSAERFTLLTKEGVVCGFVLRLRGRWHGFLLYAGTVT